MIVVLAVEGTPAPQGSKAPTRYGFRESSKRVKPWREAVQKAATAEGDRLGLFETLTPPYRVETWFFIRKPRTSKQPHPTAPTIGDGDKLTRATWDALVKGGLLEDDRFITEWAGSKEWASEGEPGAVIRITEI